MTDGPSGSYENIFENQGIPEQFRGPEDYFFHTVTEAESEAHAGETYAIPRQVYVHGDMHGLYDVYDNGAIVNTRASLRGEDISVEPRAVVGESLIEGDTKIGWAAVIHTGVHLNYANIGESAEIGPRADVRKADVGSRTKIGESVEVNISRAGTVIGSDVTIEDYAHLLGDNVIGDSTKIEWHARLERGATVGSNVQVERMAKIGERARVQDDARVMPSVNVRAGKKIRKGSIVVPKNYSRAIRGW